MIPLPFLSHSLLIFGKISGFTMLEAGGKWLFDMRKLVQRVRVMFINAKCTIFSSRQKGSGTQLNAIFDPCFGSTYTAETRQRAEKCQPLALQQQRCIRTTAEQTKKMVLLRLTSPLRAVLRPSTHPANFVVKSFCGGAYRMQVWSRLTLSSEGNHTLVSLKITAELGS